MRFATLLFLAIERGKPIPRSAISELLWPGTPEGQARHSLRHVAYVLRGMGVPVTEGSSFLELPTNGVDLDYESALALDQLPEGGYQVFLPGYSPSFSDSFAEWVDAQRNHVHARIRTRLLSALVERRERGQWSELEDVAKQCLRFDPLNEHATLALAEATAMNGSKAAAIAILDRFIVELNAVPIDVRTPAVILRKRIAERLTIPYSASSECFVGRTDTLSLLTSQLRRARAGQGAACLLWGSAGIGKSRVVLEATRIATLEGVRVRRTGCQATDLHRPLSVFADLVPYLLDLPGSLGCSPESRQYLSRLTQADPADNGLQLRRQDAAPEAAFSYAQVRQAVLELLGAVCDEAPLMVVVEDAHWIDPTSARMIRELVERIQNFALHLVITSRQHPPADSPLAERLAGLTVNEIRPLTDRDARLLFSSITAAADRAVDAKCIDRSVALAEGNPFFVRELATMWAVGGNMHQLPASLTAALDARLEQVDGASLRVLQVCALLGKNATVSRIERALGYPQFQLVDCLQSLDTLGLLATDERQIAVRHDLLGEAALSRLSSTARRFLHRCIGVALEADIDPEHSGALWGCAWHLQQAGEGTRALGVLRRCARQALDLGSPRHAVEILEQAIDMCDTDEERSQVRSSLIMALRSAGLWTRILDVHQAYSPASPDSIDRPSVHDDVELAVLEAQWDTNRKLPALLEQALLCLRAYDAPLTHRVKAGIWALILAHNLPDAEVAAQAYQTLQQLGSMSETRQTDRLTADLIYHTAFGDLAFGAASGLRLVSMARDASDLASLSRVLRLAAVPLIYLGRFGDGRVLLNEALDILKPRGLEWGTFVTTAFLVRSYFEEGDLVGSKQWYARLRALVESSQDPGAAYVAHLLGAQIALVEHRYDSPEVLRFPHWRRCDAIPSKRARSIALAVCALSTLRRGLTTEHSQILSRLDHVFSQAKCSANQDFPAFALYEGHRAVGESARATASLHQYLEVDRRERSPIPPYLSEVVAGIGADRHVSVTRTNVEPAQEVPAERAAQVRSQNGSGEAQSACALSR